jgi:energy-coupling factor transporter transmembrane protein EcfT
VKKKYKATPWSYRRVKSPIHNVPARIKLTLLLTVSLASFFPNLIVLSGILLVLACLSIVAGFLPWELLRGSRPLFFVLLWATLFRSIELSPEISTEMPLGFLPFAVRMEELWMSILFGLRVAAAFMAGALFFSVTTSSETRKALARVESFLKLERLNISLSLSLMLGFLPYFFVVWEDLSLAWKSRGGGRGLSYLVVIVPLAVEKMMHRAALSALAMEARGKLC